MGMIWSFIGPPSKDFADNFEILIYEICPSGVPKTRQIVFVVFCAMHGGPLLRTLPCTSFLSTPASRGHSAGHGITTDVP